MASKQVEIEGSERELKHLGFVKILTVNAVVMLSNIYDYAKQNSGQLKSTVGSVENAVTTVIGPVYDKFKTVPGDLLVFLDKKVDEASHKFKESAPPMAKDVVNKAQCLVKKTSVVAEDLVKEAQVAGPASAVVHAGMMTKHLAISQLAVLWYTVNHHQKLHGAAEVAVPKIANLSEKYNSFVKDMAAKGHSLFQYVPLVPVEEMTKAYEEVETAKSKKTDKGVSSGSDSD